MWRGYRHYLNISNMANGFITLENGEGFYTRWTGYDMILQIVIRELADIQGGGELAKMGVKYSNLNPDRITELMSMHDKISHDFTIEKELDVSLIIAGDKIDKIGPGWGNNASKT